MRPPWTDEELSEARRRRLRRYWAISSQPCRLCGSKESFITHWCQESSGDIRLDDRPETLTIADERFRYPWVAHQSGRGNWVVDGRYANAGDAERIARQIRQRTKRKTVIVEAATRQQAVRALDSGSLI